MRNRLLVTITLLFGCAGLGALTISWTHGQEPPRLLPKDLPAVEVQAPPLVTPMPEVRPVSTNPVLPKAIGPVAKAKPTPFDRFRNLEAQPELTKQMVMSAQLGMEWLHRYHQANGLFLRGYLPAVNQSLEGENLLQQVKAAFVLARAARFTGDDRYAVRANQAVLTLLSTTTVDAATPGVRYPAEPSVVCNRLGMAGFLLMAIHELPDPAADLLAKGEELAAFIRQRQNEDGTLHYTDGNENDHTVDRDGVNHYPGPALYALALSQRNKPAVWKTETIKRAVTTYRKWFKDHPDPHFTPWMTAACTESYAMTKENLYAEFAFEMNDWLCGLQYQQSPDPRKPMWRGGFKNVVNGKLEPGAPGIEAAVFAQGLADCCCMVRMMSMPDIERYERYRSSLIRALQFLTTLQFTESNTLHIAANYRLMLVGGFHPTQMDGNLRIDQTAQATSAFIQFLVSGADRAQ